MKFPFPLLPPLSFLMAAVLCTLVTPFVRTLAVKFGAVAVPRERDVHKQTIPRWGGLAMYAAFMVTMAAVYLYCLILRPESHWFPRTMHNPWEPKQFTGIMLGATLVAVSGAIDDKYEISALWQSLTLIAAGLILVAFDVRIEGITDPFGVWSSSPRVAYDTHSWLAFSPLWSTFFTVLWVFGVAKTVDFMDGLDGLAAGIAVISGSTLALMAAQVHQYGVSIIAATLVGVCIGFLRHNYNPASIIMGTVGAQFIGFVLAAVACLGTFKIAATLTVALPILVLGVPIFDGVRVVFKRLVDHVPAHHPDRTSHLHHILINRGLSTKQAVWVIYVMAMFLCFVALALFHFTKH